MVNYHHSSFAAARAKAQAVATIYTMHNCYLWMDDAARQQIGVGLLDMDRVIAVSRQVAQFAVAQFDFPGDRIDVVANGLRDDIMSRATAPSIVDGAAATLLHGGDGGLADPPSRSMSRLPLSPRSRRTFPGCICG